LHSAMVFELFLIICATPVTKPEFSRDPSKAKVFFGRKMK
jgi:hypothetical protein